MTLRQLRTPLGGGGGPPHPPVRVNDFYCPFCKLTSLLPSCSHDRSKMPKTASGCPKIVQDASKMIPRWVQDFSKMGPQNGPQSGLKNVQKQVQKITPNIAKNCQIVGLKADPKMAKDGELRPPANLDGAILKALVSKMSPRWLKMAPSSPRALLRPPQDGKNAQAGAVRRRRKTEVRSCGHRKRTPGDQEPTQTKPNPKCI